MGTSEEHVANAKIDRILTIRFDLTGALQYNCRANKMIFILK